MATWIFQGNPKRFEIDRYLRQRREILWTVTHHASEIAVGDEVFIWRSDGGNKGSGGVVARGVVTSPVMDVPDDAVAMWKEGEEKADAPSVRIRIEEPRLSNQEGMLLRTDLACDEILGGLGVIRFANATNYKVDEKQAQRLRYLWTIAK